MKRLVQGPLPEREDLRLNDSTAGGIETSDLHQYSETDLRAQHRGLLVELSRLEGWSTDQLGAELREAVTLEADKLPMMSKALLRRYRLAEQKHM